MEATGEFQIRVSPPIRPYSNQEMTVPPFQSHILSGERMKGSSGPVNKDQFPGIRASDELKLRREYLYGEALRQKTQNDTKNQKYRYDVDKIPDQQFSPEQEIRSIQSHKSAFLQDKIRNMREQQNETMPNPNSIGNSKTKSILYESSMSKTLPLGESSVCCNVSNFTINYDKDIDIFKKKVVQVNDQIEEGISHLEAMIQEVRKKKLEKSMVKSKLTDLRGSSATKKAENVLLSSPILEVTQQSRSISKVSAFSKSQILAPIIQEQPASQSIHLEADLGHSSIPFENSSENPCNNEKSVTVMAESQASKAIEQQPLASGPEEMKVLRGASVSLVGGEQTKKVYFPPQYTAFINRLSNQIQLDMQFTNLVIHFSKQQQLETIRELILSQISKYKGQGIIRQKFFKVAPQQMDPLESGKPYIMRRWSEEELKQEAFRLYKKYKEIETHFSSKLSHRFNPQIVNMLFQDLVQFNFTKSSLSDGNSVTVGHLLSYLNMRTTKNFRNRFFYKMLQRLGLTSSAHLTPQVMSQFANSG